MSLPPGIFRICTAIMDVIDDGGQIDPKLEEATSRLFKASLDKTAGNAKDIALVKAYADKNF